MITAKDLAAEEKLRLICGQDTWHTVDLGGKIPQLTVSDGPVGLRKSEYENGVWKRTIPSVAYPSIQNLANTWSRESAKEMGGALADDCLDADVDILLAPGINIKRIPQNGRNFEYFSEDPLLAGTLAYEYIVGLQEGGVGACVKHFCANNLEYNRMEQSSEVDERTLREVYYKPFEIACRAKPVSVMCCYNRVNGVFGSENIKGFDVLRKDFGFDGAIFSDWLAVHDRAAAAKAGLDLEMPFLQKNYEKLCADYEKGILSDEELNVCAQRVLDLVYRCKSLRRGKKAKRSVKTRLETAQKIAEESIVLLKNNGVLPLKKGAAVSVCGEFAVPQDYGKVSGGGSSLVQWLGEKYDLAGILKEKLKGAVDYFRAFGDFGLISGGNDIRKLFDSVRLSDVNIICAGTGCAIEGEGFDRAGLRLTPRQEEMILRLAEINPNTVVVLTAGSAVDVSVWKDKVAAIVWAGFCGERGGEAVARVLTGEVNPSGKLSETFPCKIEDTPAYFSYNDPFVARYEEGLDIGYRHYDRRGLEVSYPFGFGLSYSEYEYKNLELKTCANNVVVRYDITNISERAGKEISQIYIRPCSPFVYRPVCELKEFSKDEILAGETKRIEIVLSETAFSYYSVAKDKWQCDGGLYEIQVGASSRDIRLAGFVRIVCGKFEVVSKREREAGK